MEDVRHLHLHMLPRTRDLPAGNVPVTLFGAAYRGLAAAGLNRPYSEDQVEAMALRQRAAFEALGQGGP